MVVDFFFILSGFVIAYAYGGRLDDDLSWARFMRLRLLRLYPMLFIGVLVAGLVFLGRQALYHTGLLSEAVILTALSLSLLPVGLLYGIACYPIDNPVWSLFFEFVANAVFASPIRRLGRRWIITLLTIAVVALIVLAARFGTVSCLGFVGPGSFLAGFVRVAVPFTLGAVIWRMKLFTKFPSVAFPIIALGFVIALCLHTAPRWTYDLVGVLVIFPLFVCLGAKARVGARAKKFCTVARQVSYPLYIMHMSVLRTVDMAYKVSHVRIGPFLPMCLGIALSLLVSWVLLRVYDEPVRKWIGKRNSRSRTLATPVSVN